MITQPREHKAPANCTIPFPSNPLPKFHVKWNCKINYEMSYRFKLKKLSGFYFY